MCNSCSKYETYCIDTVIFKQSKTYGMISKMFRWWNLNINNGFSIDLKRLYLGFFFKINNFNKSILITQNQFYLIFDLIIIFLDLAWMGKFHRYNFTFDISNLFALVFPIIFTKIVQS